jgi:excisionase family DNA binding protein
MQRMERRPIVSQGRVTYSVKEVAAKTGLSLSGVYQLAERGEIPSTRAGRRWLIPASWLDSLDPDAAAALADGHTPTAQAV